MDKVKIALALLKKHHFWVLCGLILIVSLVCWSMAASDLSDRFTKRKQELDGKFTNVRAIPEQSNHPNEASIKVVQNLHGQIGEDVLAAWSRLFKEQRDNNPLPVIEGDKGMQDKFVAEFESKWGALEKLEKLDADKEMTDKYREDYSNHIHDHFRTLDDMVDRRHEVVDDSGAGAGVVRPVGLPAMAPAGANQGPRQFKGTVDWADSEVQKLTNRFASLPAVPSTLVVLMSQEDLWVYEALLKVVHNTNNTGSDPKTYVGPTSHKMASIKRILAMEIGQDAVRSWQKSQQSVIKLAGGSAGPGGAAGASPLAGRYVDDKGMSVADPNQQPFAEFRMMPIALRVVIEQKAIPKLLAECANSKMPINIRSLRVLSKEVQALVPGAGGGVGGAGGEDDNPAAGGGGAAAPGIGRTVAGDQDEESINPLEPPVPVELQGIIYIYNPPDKDKLGTGTAGGAVATAGAPLAPANPPASGPQAPAGPAAKPAVETPSAAPGPAPTATPPAATPPAGPPPAGTPPVAAPASPAAPAPPGKPNPPPALPAAGPAAKGGQP